MQRCPVSFVGICQCGDLQAAFRRRLLLFVYGTGIVRNETVVLVASFSWLTTIIIDRLALGLRCKLRNYAAVRTYERTNKKEDSSKTN